MAKITEYSFRSCDEEHTPIHAVKWEPDDGKVIATLQLVHGMQEYIERYDEFATYLTGKGFAVFGHDHIGHGLSVSSPKELGMMHSRYPDDTMVEDIFENFGIIRKEYPDKPYFILGHSMGSYLLRKYLVAKVSSLKDVNGAIIMGTGSEPDGAVLAGRIMCSVIRMVKGRDAKSEFIKGIMFGGGSYAGYDATGEHPENSWLSKNVENVKEFLDPANPRSGYDFSLNGYMVLLRSIWFDNRMSNIRKMNPDIPVIFVSGDRDPVGAMGKGVRRAYDKFAKAKIKDLSIKLYEGDRHEILNELDRDRVYYDLYEWMSKRFKT